MIFKIYLRTSLFNKILELKTKSILLKEKHLNKQLQTSNNANNSFSNNVHCLEVKLLSSCLSVQTKWQQLLI